MCVLLFRTRVSAAYEGINGGRVRNTTRQYHVAVVEFKYTLWPCTFLLLWCIDTYYQYFTICLSNTVQPVCCCNTSTVDYDSRNGWCLLLYIQSVRDISEAIVWCPCRVKGHGVNSIIWCTDVYPIVYRFLLTVRCVNTTRTTEGSTIVRAQ